MTIYSFGQKIERTFPAVGTEGPMLLEATGHCPPEDVGGPWGYQEFREALADPAHEQMPKSSNGGAAAIMIPPPPTSRSPTKPSMTWLQNRPEKRDAKPERRAVGEGRNWILPGKQPAEQFFRTP
ncbi:plasmid pRiA4b ORF-3 family protein [Rhizobium leguminosarum]|uniref:plasmid pRiA4b ORF-3 family protein n=1 Tax=Rhizobium TaxID=379 RepID=UPI001FE23FB1|nr:plasmid pRiA4b ORF-3 family protein [Rhizobium leguminosarum]